MSRLPLPACLAHLVTFQQRSLPSLHRLKELFYPKLISDPVLKTLFTVRRPHHVEHRFTACVLVDFSE